VLFAVCLFGQHAQGPLTDQRICDLVAAGVSAPEILRIIASAPAVDFDLRPGSTAAIMNAGVSEEMIKAMAARENGGTVIPTALKLATHGSPLPIRARAFSRGNLARQQSPKWASIGGKTASGSK
jgi:hypothetical protein